MSAAALKTIAIRKALASSRIARGFSRRAEKRAPATEPIASMELSNPKPPAPVANTVTAIVETNTAKFMPNVATRNSMVSTAMRSGRPST